MALEQFIKRLFLLKPPGSQMPVASGLYHYTRESGSDAYEPGAYTRFHLRVDPDGFGMLLANAAAAARLSPAGVVIAKGLLDDLEEERIYEQLKRTFRGASQSQMQSDLEEVAALLANLVAPGDNYPIINFEDAAISPYESRLMAPFQADVPLAEPEILIPIIDRLWQAAIPHVKLLTPPDFELQSLLRAIERAEDLGMIAGVRSRATDLNQASVIRELAMSGVDYITVPFASFDGEFHDAIWGTGDHEVAQSLFSILPEFELPCVVEQLLVQESLDKKLDRSLEVLLAAGVTNIDFFAITAPDKMIDEQREGGLPAAAMLQVADLVEELANQMRVRFIWLPPVMRQANMTLPQQVRKGPRCSGDVSVRVETNGDVIPPRGPYRVAGNLLSSEWSSIWNDDAFLNYRDRVEQPTRCDDCPDLAICAVDCPRKMAGWSQGYGRKNHE